MHRHGFKGRKLGRKRDLRRILLKNLATDLLDHQKLTTTLIKAKEIVPYTERLITKAKKGDLHHRRQVISKLAKPAIAHKLVDELAPKLQKRQSGYFRIVKLQTRLGDGAQLARVSFVDNLSPKKVASTSTTVKSKTSKVNHEAPKV